MFRARYVGGRHSATRIHPELPPLQVGDTVPMGAAYSRRSPRSSRAGTCPLAEHYGAPSGSVPDIYLPKWFAHNMPAIHLTRTAQRGDTQRVAMVPDALRLLGVLVTYPVSRRPVRPLAEEAMRSLPGDELVAGAKIRWSHAITIRARPADIWPWLVQMGCRRAGWYSYDGLDNGGVPSAQRIVPERQRVQVGDIFPMPPKAQDRFVVRVAVPDRALVLGDDCRPDVLGVRARVGRGDAHPAHHPLAGTTGRLALGLMLKVFWHPLDFGMQRRQLLNLKRLVETA